MTELQIDKRLASIEKELETIRGKEYDLRWQSMRRAKVSRKWDKLAEEKMRLLALKDEINSPETPDCSK